jgi:uncharacterized protein YjbI with pentapeptide repeats
MIHGNFIVGANPDFPGPEDNFHLHPMENPMFRPNKWKITKVRGLPLDGADVRYIDFSLDSCAVQLTRCNLREADLAEARLPGSNLTGSNLSNAGGYKVIFGEPGKPSTLDDTTWAGAGLVGSRLLKCTLKRARFDGALFGFPPPMPWPYPGIIAPDFEGADLFGANFS